MAKDMRGVEIREGDVIATAQRRSSSVWVGIYQVKTVGEVEFTFFDPQASSKRLYKRLNGDNVVVCQRATDT